MAHGTTNGQQPDPDRLEAPSRRHGVGLWTAALHDGDPMHARTRWSWSDEVRRLLGYRSITEFPDTMRSWRESLHPDDLGPALQALRTGCATGAGFDISYRLRRRDGSYRRFRATGAAVLDASGRARLACGSLTEVPDAAARDRPPAHADGWDADGWDPGGLIRHLPDAVLIVGADLGIRYQNPAAERVWGYAPGMLAGHPLAALVHPDDRRIAADLWERLRDVPGGTGCAELRLRPRHGGWRHAELVATNLLHEPAIGGMMVTARDIEQRKVHEQLLTRQAFHDALTGLPNRALCQDRLDQALACGEGRHIALMVVDLDGFKLVNEGLGHTVGDQLLVAAAERLLAACRPGDTVARPGGDEFIVLLQDLPDDAAALEFANTVTRAFERPFTLSKRSLAVTVSVGVAVGRTPHCSADALLQDADIAMFHAKAGGKGRAMIFDVGMNGDSLARLELEADLRRALERDELCVHYQPIVELGSGRLLEVEALVRWNHPVRGLLPPAEFIPLAEVTGLIVPLGKQVLAQACRQAARWQAAYALDPPLTLSVNLSPRQFQEPSLDTGIAAILRQTGMDPAHLKLEITEGVVMNDVERTIPILDRLKASGIRLAIDDFGTGYSSLAYLRRLPLDVLKIDRSFVSGIAQRGDDLAIIRAIISLADSLRLSVTAEGIETAAQAEILTGLGCDRGQGYLFSRPVDAATATRMIEATWRPAPCVVPDLDLILPAAVVSPVGHQPEDLEQPAVAA